MKILFLDVDGVLNKLGSTPETRTKQRVREGGLIIGVEPELCRIVEEIVESTGCKVVLSSSWRDSDPNDEGMVYLKENLNFGFYDITPRTRTGFRGEDILQWFCNNSNSDVINCTKYAILDDENDFFKFQPWFQSNHETGITRDLAYKIIGYLNS